jgi:hypothetical protein
MLVRSIVIHAKGPEIRYPKRAKAQAFQRARVRAEEDLAFIWGLKDWGSHLDPEVQAIVRESMIADHFFPILYREIATFSTFKKHVDDARRLGATIKIEMYELRAQFSADGGAIFVEIRDPILFRSTTWKKIVERSMRDGKDSVQLRKVPKDMIALCARRLAEHFKRKSGNWQWDQVGNIITANWPNVVPPDDGRRDLGAWIYNLVKRHAKRLGDYVPPGVEPDSWEKQAAKLLATHKRLGLL